jgi:hypothetical protein
MLQRLRVPYRVCLLATNTPCCMLASVLLAASPLVLPDSRRGRRLDQCLDELVLRRDDDAFLLQLLVRGV